jgi:hypothetical protein
MFAVMGYCLGIGGYTIIDPERFKEPLIEHDLTSSGVS